MARCGACHERQKAIASFYMKKSHCQIDFSMKYFETHHCFPTWLVWAVVLSDKYIQTHYCSSGFLIFIALNSYLVSCRLSVKLFYIFSNSLCSFSFIIYLIILTFKVIIKVYFLLGRKKVTLNDLHETSLHFSLLCIHVWSHIFALISLQSIISNHSWGSYLPSQAHIVNMALWR